MSVQRFYHTYRSPKDDCGAQIVLTAQKATTSIRINIYGFTYRPLIDVLKAKRAAGLLVQVAVDSTQAAGHYQHPLMQELVDADIDLVITRSPAGGIDHDKVLIRDAELGVLSNDSVVALGSWNFSSSAATQENTLLVTNDPSICQDCLDQFNEAYNFGQKHAAWQLRPAASAPTTEDMPPVVVVTDAPVVVVPPADVAGASAPPAQPEPAP